MNIFATSSDPIRSAQALDDLRLNKMIVESCQILSAALHVTGRGTPDLYQPAYTRHPVVLWTADDPEECGWTSNPMRNQTETALPRSSPSPHRSASFRYVYK